MTSGSLTQALPISGTSSVGSKTKHGGYMIKNRKSAKKSKACEKKDVRITKKDLIEEMTKYVKCEDDGEKLLRVGLVCSMIDVYVDQEVKERMDVVGGVVDASFDFNGGQEK